jgi:hypothetical protein
MTAGRLGRDRPELLWVRLFHVDEAAVTKFFGRVVDARSGDIGEFTHILGGPFTQTDECDERPGGVGTEAERFELFDGRGSRRVGWVVGHFLVTSLVKTTVCGGFDV